MKSQILSALIEANRAKVPVALLTDLGNGQQWVVDAATLPAPDGVGAGLIARSRALLAEDRNACFESAFGPIFIRVFNPPLQLILVGDAHIARPLAQLVGLAGYDTLILDPHSAFARRRRSARRSGYTRWPAEALAKVSGNARTALVTLTDDPQFDEPALDWALRTPAFYIGAVGNRQTHESRLQRLAELGFSTLDRARIHGLIGHSIGAMAPIEIAISIMAQITQARHEGLASMSSAEAPLASAACMAFSAPLTAEDEQHARNVQLSKEGFCAGVVAGPPIDEVAEDEAAHRIAAALCGGLVHQTPANAGRSNLLATERGLVIASTEALHAINAAHEGITVATLTPYATVAPGQTLATIKIIPHAVPEAAVRRCCEVAAAARPVLRVAPFGAKRVALIQTQRPTAKGSLLDKAFAATRARLAALGLDFSSTRICAHTVGRCCGQRPRHHAHGRRRTHHRTGAARATARNPKSPS